MGFRSQLSQRIAIGGLSGESGKLNCINLRVGGKNLK